MSDGPPEDGNGVGDEADPEAARPRPASDRPLPRGSSFDFLHEAVADAGAAGFVAVGRDGGDLRYLAGAGTDRERALVVAEGGAALSLPPATPLGDPPRTAPHPESPVAAERRDGDTSAGGHAVSLLARVAGGERSEGGSGTVLVPRDLPHDAAVHLERAGYDLASTRAVSEARATKADAERDRLRAAQRVAAAGVGRAGRLLDGPRDDAPPEAAGVEREVTAALAAAGAADVSRTRVVADGPADTTAPVVLSLAPRLPDGYYARLVRTLVASGDGGWERRAHVAVTSALRVAAAELGPGVDADAVRREATAELGSFGFAPSEGGTDAGVDVYGVGVAAREPPLAERREAVPDGAVVAVDVRVADGEGRTVRLADLFAVVSDGTTVLGDVPRSLAPGAYQGFGPSGSAGSGPAGPGSPDCGSD